MYRQTSPGREHPSGACELFQLRQFSGLRQGRPSGLEERSRRRGLVARVEGPIHVDDAREPVGARSGRSEAIGRPHSTAGYGDDPKPSRAIRRRLELDDLRQRVDE